LLPALAYESLSQGRALHRSGALPTLGLALLVLMFLGRALSARGWRRGLLLLLVLATGLYAGALAAQAALPFSLDLAPPLAAAVGLYAFGVLRDLEQETLAALTHRLSALRRRALMQCVLEDSFDGIIIARADGMIELVNPSGGRLLDHTPEDMIGKPIDLFLPASTALHDKAMAAPAGEVVQASRIAKRWLKAHGDDAIPLARDMVAEFEESGNIEGARMWVVSRRVV
jgi:PAS domain-containing protein